MTKYTPKLAHLVLFNILALSIVAAVYWFTSVSNNPPSIPSTQTELRSILWPEPKPLPQFTLTNHHGNEFKRESFQGHWTFLFFGYTSCPDICPSMLATVQAIADQITLPPGASEKPQYVFVSIDPQRDTPERLGEYLKYFNSGFIGVTGTDTALAALASELFVMYERGVSRGEDDYDMNHTASILMIDPDARLFGRFSPPHNPSQMVAQFNQLREHYQKSSQR